MVQNLKICGYINFKLIDNLLGNTQPDIIRKYENQAQFYGDKNISNFILRKSNFSISSCNNVIALSFYNKFLVLKAKNKDYFKKDFNILHEQDCNESIGYITSILCLPVYSKKDGKNTLVILFVGFTSGRLRAYTENGKFLFSFCMDDSSIVCLKINALNNHPNDHSDLAVEESKVCQLLILHKSCLVLIPASYLYDLVEKILKGDLLPESTIDLNNVPSKKLWIKGKQQNIQDIALCGLSRLSTFDQLRLISCFNSFRTNTPPSSDFHSYAICGFKPFLGLYYLEEEGETVPKNLTDQLSAATSRLKDTLTSSTSALMSNLPGFLKSGISNVSSSKLANTLSDATSKVISRLTLGNLNLRYGLLDSRSATHVVASPDRSYLALTDNLGRVLIVDVELTIIIHMLKGYRDASCGWIGMSKSTDPTSDKFRSQPFFLVIYAPRRGLLEIWDVSSTHTRRLKAVNVSKFGRLIYTVPCYLSPEGCEIDVENQFESAVQCFLIEQNGMMKKIVMDQKSYYECDTSKQIGKTKEFELASANFLSKSDNFPEELNTLMDQFATFYALENAFKRIIHLFEDSPLEKVVELTNAFIAHGNNLANADDINENFVEKLKIFLAILKIYHSLPKNRTSNDVLQPTKSSVNMEDIFSTFLNADPDAIDNAKNLVSIHGYYQSHLVRPQMKGDYTKLIFHYIWSLAQYLGKDKNGSELVGEEAEFDVFALTKAIKVQNKNLVLKACKPSEHGQPLFTNIKCQDYNSIDNLMVVSESYDLRLNQVLNAIGQHMIATKALVTGPIDAEVGTNDITISLLQLYWLYVVEQPMDLYEDFYLTFEGIMSEDKVVEEWTLVRKQIHQSPHLINTILLVLSYWRYLSLHPHNETLIEIRNTTTYCIILLCLQTILLANLSPPITIDDSTFGTEIMNVAQWIPLAIYSLKTMCKSSEAIVLNSVKTLSNVFTLFDLNPASAWQSDETVLSPCFELPSSHEDISINKITMLTIESALQKMHHFNNHESGPNSTAFCFRDILLAYTCRGYYRKWECQHENPIIGVPNDSTDQDNEETHNSVTTLELQRWYCCFADIRDPIIKINTIKCLWDSSIEKKLRTLTTAVNDIGEIPDARVCERSLGLKREAISTFSGLIGIMLTDVYETLVRKDSIKSSLIPSLFTLGDFESKDKHEQYEAAVDASFLFDNLVMDNIDKAKITFWRDCCFILSAIAKFDMEFIHPSNFLTIKIEDICPGLLRDERRNENVDELLNSDEVESDSRKIYRETFVRNILKHAITCGSNSQNMLEIDPPLSELLFDSLDMEFWYKVITQILAIDWHKDINADKLILYTLNLLYSKNMDAKVEKLIGMSKEKQLLGCHIMNIAGIRIIHYMESIEDDRIAKTFTDSLSVPVQIWLDSLDLVYEDISEFDYCNAEGITKMLETVVSLLPSKHSVSAMALSLVESFKSCSPHLKNL